MLRFARFTAVVLAVLTPAALTAAPVPKGAKQPVAVAYIHAADEQAAGAFQKLLDAEGFTVELLAHDAVAKADLSKYGLLVVGHDTEHSKWGEAAAAVEKSGKPVLGLGEGGYAAFGESGLKLAIGAPHGWHGIDAAVRPVDAAKSPLWAAAGMAGGKAVTLYEKTTHVGIHLPNPPADVVLLGRELVSPNHFALARQGDRFVLWGFTAGPDAMTADGRKLFVATCRYAAGLGRASDKKWKTCCEPAEAAGGRHADRRRISSGRCVHAKAAPMTEAYWLAATDPPPMLTFVRGKVSDRKLRLFACACCRRLWEWMTEPDHRRQVEIAEAYADGRVSEVALHQAFDNPDGSKPFVLTYRHYVAAAAWCLGWPDAEDPDWTEAAQAVIPQPWGPGAYAEFCTWRVCKHAAGAAGDTGSTSFILGFGREWSRAAADRESASQAELFRDIVSNPFRPVAFDPAWRTETVVALAAGIYTKRAFDRMPILADALEEAGCDHPDVLAHCRRPDADHVRGCWVVDLVLGRS